MTKALKLRPTRILQERQTTPNGDQYEVELECSVSDCSNTALPILHKSDVDRIERGDQLYGCGVHTLLPGFERP